MRPMVVVDANVLVVTRLDTVYDEVGESVFELVSMGCSRFEINRLKHTMSGCETSRANESEKRKFHVC